jgi:CO/xanthine dehydrogenase Mo-binding subunit
MPGVLQIVRDGSFLAVLAQREEQAIWAADALAEKAIWQNDTTLPPMEALFDHLTSQPAESSLVVNGTAGDDPIPPIETPPNAAQTLNTAFYSPYHMHGSLSPSAAVAKMADGKLTIWSHSQGVPLLQHTIAHVLDMDPADIHLIHTEGSGCYGHNAADDAALDAALLARAMPERPISLKWSRKDEHTWEPYGTAMAFKMQASLDQDGRLIDWNHDVWSYPHTNRPRPGSTTTSGFPAAQYLAKPFEKPQPRPIQGYHFGDYRNADPLYTFPKRRIVTHFVPNSPLRTSSLRSLGAYANVFAIESFMDELAHAANIDPATFRLQNLADERARAVITAAVEKSGWQPSTQPAANGIGTGFAFAQYKNIQAYAAIVVTVEVDLENGRIQLKKATIAADAGQIVNPDGLSNQLEGGFFQAASWTLAEQVSFDQDGVISRDWDSYPILRFSGSPEIKSVLLNRPNHPFLGGGEATQGPTPAAIANAIFDATGVRIRHLPLTAEKLMQQLKLGRG